MSLQQIPAHWVVRRSTPFFTRENVPAALLSHHNTAVGVFGQLCVMEGTVTYYGFATNRPRSPRSSSSSRPESLPPARLSIGTGSNFPMMPVSISTFGPSRPTQVSHSFTVVRVDVATTGGYLWSVLPNRLV